MAFSGSPMFRNAILSLGLIGSLGACSHQEPPANAPNTATDASSSAAPATGAPPAVPVSATGASVFVVHQVSDFDAFKKYFEDGSAARGENGVKGFLLSRVDDGRVVIHFFADDADKVQAALNSARMQEYLSRAGAPDASVVWVTKNVVVSLPAAPPSGETYSLYLKLHVSDFEAFRRAFDERSAGFSAEGVLGYGLHQSVLKDDIVILHFVGNVRDKLEALPSRPALAELLKSAKPDSSVKPIIAVDVARSRSNP